MGTIRKVIGALLLITAILVTQVPAVKMNAAPSSDFQIDKTTLVKYTGTASSVSIPSSIKTIGAEAFAGNTSLTSISIGENVTEIEYGAFKDCTYLTNVKLTDSLTTIGNAVFSNNTSLKKITLPKNLKVLGSGVFAGCDKLSTIGIAKENPYFVFEKNALYDKEKTLLYCYTEGSKSKSYSMPDTVIDIDEYAFWGNDALQEIKFSTNLREIPSYAFSNCRNLLAISVPYSVKSINSKAFENCISLQKVMIPASVSYIHSTAFDGCPKLVISADSGSVAHEFYQNWKLLNKTEVDSEKEEGDTVVDSGGNVYIVGSDGKLVKVEGSSSSSSSSSDSAIHDPSNVDYVPEFDPIATTEEGVLGKTMIVDSHAVLMMNSPQMKVVNGLNIREVSAAEEESANNTNSVDESKGDALPKYAIVYDHITDYAYYGDADLYTYTIPSNITSIGDFAFSRSNLKSINIPKGVSTIGYAAFYHCDNLNEISIPETVTWIEPSAFSHTGWLNAWAANTSADDFLIVGDGLLIAYKGNQKYVEIPDTVETIAPACFLGHSEILGVNIPNSVTIIGEEAFKDCTSLQEVHGAENVVKIQDRAFENTNLKEITIHKYVEQIGVGAFNCNTDSNRIVYFKGDTLPKLSYTESTSRLSNDLLEPAFNKNWTAVVNDNSINLDNTILDNGYLGFIGDIATKDATGNINVFTTIDEVSSGNNSVIVNADISQWSAGQISTSLKYSGEYHLTIKEQPKTVIEDAFKRVYGNSLPAMTVFDMTLTDVTNTVKLTGLGTNPLTVTVPLPTEIKGNTIHAVVLDEDGQLEKLSASIIEKDGKDYVKFSTNHLSTFAIYAMGEDGTVQIENGEAVTTVSGKKDYSPNTGDHSIHPKWFVAVGLSALAIAFIAYKPKRKRTK